MKSFDIEKITLIIIEKFHWGPQEEWTNFHFSELSRQIHKTTGDQISGETLKRIFGKRKTNTEHYHPQAFSQIALIKFANSIEEAQPVQETKKIHLKNRYKLTGLVILGIFIVLFLLHNFNLFESNQTSKYFFICDNPTEFAPYTATFRYDVSEIKDSVFTDFTWKQETYLPSSQNRINCFYTNPGIYTVRFYTRKKLLYKTTLTAFSHVWQGGFFPNEEPEKYKPFSDQNIFRQTDVFYAEPKDLIKEGVNLNLGDWTSYRYFSPFEKSLDSLVFETRVLNNASLGSLLCYDIGITLIGDSGIIDFKFTQLRCERFARLKLSEKIIDGEFNDMSALTADMTDWLLIKTTTSDNQISIGLGDSIIYSAKYSKPMGNLTGIIYSFYGTGKIDYLELRETNGELFYSNSFNTLDEMTSQLYPFPD